MNKNCLIFTISFCLIKPIFTVECRIKTINKFDKKMGIIKGYCHGIKCSAHLEFVHYMDYEVPQVHILPADSFMRF